ncbi:DUF4349 domain-containing protein [Amycolatopsis alkalitolerans]|uniref:DUF4349 domain-containing protein n=1 Tax=Amycolatopsis alkalitolerans TaxID=2547244 RepID=UPI00135C4406|nr:DUF4349 domain-containing protein [Amycolatopsis alkalitolerans]
MRAGLLLTGLAVLALASGCTGTATSDRAAAPAQGGVAQPEHQSQANGQPRQLARSARLAMTATDIRAVTAEARQIAVAAGGYSGSERTDVGSANIALAVPDKTLDDVIGQLSRLGQVTSTEQTAQDLTEQVMDLDSRLETARRSVDRIRALLDRAASLSDITTIESQLTTRESDLESLEARQRTLTTSVAMATITLTITPAAPLPAVTAAPGFLAGLASGWSAFLTFGRTIVHALGAALPFLLIIGLLVTALWPIWRRRPHKRAQPKGSPGGSPPGGGRGVRPPM